MFKLTNLRIRGKLLLTCATLIIISNVSIGFPALYISSNVIVKKSTDYIKSTLAQISKNIDINLNQIDLASYSIISNQTVISVLRKSSSDQYHKDISNDGSVRQILVSAVLTRKDIDSIYLFDNNGKIWASREGVYSRLPPYGQLRVEADKSNGKMVWLPAQKFNTLEIPVVRNINDTATMKPIGTLLIYVKENSFSDIYISQNLKNNLAYITNRNGQIISCYDNKQVGQNIGGDIFDNIQGDAGSFSIQDGERALVIYQASKLSDWYYIYKVPYNELTRDTRYIRNWILLVMLIFTVAAFMVSYFLARSISKPMQDVVKEIDEINRDNFEIDVQYRGKDELGVLVDAINKMMNKVRDLIGEVYVQKIYKQEQEIKTLQAQINPHFLYNTLESINWMGQIHHAPQISLMTTLLGDIMRYSINTKSDMVDLSEELEYIRKYLSIQKIRYGDKLNVFYDIQDDVLSSVIPKLTIQPIVENAIFHGIEKKAGIGRIRLICLRENDCLKIIVEDNGAGMGEERLQFIVKEINPNNLTPSQSNIGLSNVNKRIKIHFGAEYGLEIKSQKDVGTRVCINLPYKPET